MGTEDQGLETESAPAQSTAESAPLAAPAAVAAGPEAAPRRPRIAWRPLLLALGAGGGVLLLMANERQLRFGALYGALLLAVCVGATLRAIGLLRAFEDAPPVSLATAWFAPLPGEPAWAAPRTTVPVALIVLAALAAILGGHGLPWAIAAALCVLFVSALRRPGWMVFVVASALYLPLLGKFGLWDPWETHYGEVSREILSRDDWISLWWAQDRWFWSKPILIFWSEALVWSASGLGFLPDSNTLHTEWVLRLPTYAYSMLGLLCAYAATSRIFNPRAGLLGALALATTPYYAMMTHQAITDMPCVGTMVAAVMMLLLAVNEDPEREVRSYRVGRLVVSAHEVVLGMFLLICLPQILYLISRNVTFVHGLFAWHRDDFLFGSGHNPMVPGNFGLHEEHPHVRVLWAEPIAQALLWALCTAAVVFQLRRERRAQALYMIAFYVFCGLSFMAKGIPGFAEPGLVALLLLIGCNRWSLLFAGRLRVALGALALTTLSLPWFVAMYVRHGKGFTDRLLIHDHLNRLASGVHGDTGSIQYFIEQLGFGMFPWIALVPLALAPLGLSGAWLARTPAAPEPPGTLFGQRQTAIVLGLWFAAAFTLYSAMITKFHHYVFPASPPAALLVGVLLDRMLGARAGRRSGRSWLALVLSLLAPVPLVIGVAGLRGNLRGVLPADVSAVQRALWAFQHGPDRALCFVLIALGLGAIAAAFALGRRAEPGASDAAGAREQRMLGAGLFASALICAFVGRDMSWTTAQRPAGQERLIQLFIYNYERPFPAQFDYRPMFTGFAVVATLLLLVAVARALRPVAVQAFVGLCVVFALFFLDVYMIDLTPHWSQRDLVHRYYRERKSAADPLVAWQMNWKGENFYSGNRVAVFADLNNKEFTNWVDHNKGKTAYVLLEHGRLGRLKGLLASRKVESLTTERDNNKFVLVRVVL
jgi:4-amino-4-deoxy-L-arabinose transferase-like glycosyltransferase